MEGKEESNVPLSDSDWIKLVILLVSLVVYLWRAPDVVSAYGKWVEPVASRARWRLSLPEFRCRSAFPQQAFSNSYDLILSCVREINQFYEYLLITIRTTGCKARIIILTEVGHQIPDEYKFIIDYTDTEIVEMATPYQLSNDFTRNRWILEFLEQRRTEFRRIFVCDAFDIFFQKDIFEVFNSTDRVIFVAEGQSIGLQPLNREWMTDCYADDIVNSVADRLVLCHGTLYGGSEPLYQYYKVLMSQSNWNTKCPLDQPKLQHIAYSGILAQHGIKWEASGCEGPVLTMRQCDKMGRKINGVMMIANGIGVASHVAHQWNKPNVRRIKRVMQRKCDDTIRHMQTAWKPNWLWHNMK